MYSAAWLVKGRSPEDDSFFKRQKELVASLCSESVSVWFRSKERGRRVKDRAKNRASNCFETTQTETLATHWLVTERRLLRQYRNQPFLGTWFRFWLQFLAAVIKIILKTFGKLCWLCRLHKLDM